MDLDIMEAVVIMYNILYVKNLIWVWLFLHACFLRSDLDSARITSSKKWDSHSYQLEKKIPDDISKVSNLASGKHSGLSPMQPGCKP